MFFKDDKKSSTFDFKDLLLAGGAAALTGFIINKAINKKIVEKPMDCNIDLDLDPKEDERVRFFLVFQNTSYEDEKNKSYIWAPKATESGRKIFHWDNLKKVREGDIVFSVVDRKIVSLNVAKAKVFDYSLDGLGGHRVDLEYNELEEEIDLDQHMDRILKLSADKYAAFNVMGRANSGYLFDLGEELGEFLLELVRKSELS